LWFSIVYNGASVLSLAILILYQFLSGGSESTSLSDRLSQTVINHPMSSISLSMDPSQAGTSQYTWYMVMLPLAIYLGVFIFTTILVFIPIPPQIFLSLTLSGLFVCGVCTSVASSGIIGTAGLFEPNLGVNPYFNGQAVGGLLVAVANVAATFFDGPSLFRQENCSSSTMLKGGHTDDITCVAYTQVSWPTVAYFSLGCLILASCMLGYTYIDQYKRLVRRSSYMPVPLIEISEDELKAWEDGEEEQVNGERFVHFSITDRVASPGGGGSPQKTRISKWLKTPSLVPVVGAETNGGGVNSRHPVSRSASAASDGSDTSQQSVTQSVWIAVQGPAVSLFCTYFVTLAIFPVWTSELLSVQQCESPSRIRNDLFTPISFVIFNGGDLVGRIISSEVSIDKIRNLSAKLVFSSILRFIFFPIFLFCAAPNSRYSSLIINSDVCSWIIQFLFAMTNGILTNVAFCYAPGLLPNRTHHQQVAAAILNFSLSFGLFCGSLFSFPFLGFATGK
jgi:hypothetical protein